MRSFEYLGLLFHVTDLIPIALTRRGMLLITCLLKSIALHIFTCILIGFGEAFKFVSDSVRANLLMKRKHTELATIIRCFRQCPKAHRSPRHWKTLATSTRREPLLRDGYSEVYRRIALF